MSRPDGPKVQRHESPLGSWRLVRWRPPGLEGLVEEIWYFEGTLARLRERHYPNGRMDLAIHFGPRYRRIHDAGSHTFSRASVSGLFLRPDVIEAPEGDSAVLGIVLHPPGALRVFGTPLQELTGRDEDLADVVPGSVARELVDRCEEVQSPVERVQRAEHWVRQRLVESQHLPPSSLFVLRAAEEIRLRQGVVAIEKLGRVSGWSRTRFTSVFREQVGLPPKTFARVHRFERALRDVTRGELRLSDIALDAGYYDQAHFNRDFREFAGVTPSAYRARLRFPKSRSTAEPAH
jgi:AraC-like DNA-binding protein